MSNYPRVKKSCIQSAENILEINGVGESTFSGILAEIGGVSRFDDEKEIQRLSGLNLVTCSSGKHKGQTKNQLFGTRYYDTHHHRLCFEVNKNSQSLEKLTF